jgi:hypothetical protein
MGNSKYKLVLPYHEGYTEQDYLEYLGEAKPQEAGLQEYLEAFGTIIMTIFIGFLKFILFFIREYPKALEEIREEERKRQK